jgi:type II secretory pathway pseudopilin PulG
MEDRGWRVEDGGSRIEGREWRVEDYSVWLPFSILNPQSSILHPRSSIRYPPSSILNPSSSILNSQSSILDPLSSILIPCNLSPVPSKEAGYTLAVVMVFTSVLLVMLSGAAINWQKAIQREREEELIYRGKQFMRAVELWQRKFPGTYPTTLDALLSTNNTRFLRKKWKDPITNSNEWRLLKVNPDGSISGLTVIPGSSPLGASAYGSSGSSGSSSSGARASGGTASGTSSSGGTGRVQQGSSSSGARPVQSAFNPVLGGIVGVASKSEKQSLKSYNGRSKYNEWEFVFIPRGPQPGAGQNLPQGGQPGPQGGPQSGGRNLPSGFPQPGQPQAPAPQGR